jgi:hypothetical protein
MKTRLIFVMALIMMGTISCEKIGVGSWDVQENTYQDLVFPKEATLTFVSEKEGKLNLLLTFGVEVDFDKRGDRCRANVSFNLRDAPYEVNGKRLRICADKLHGCVTYTESYYGFTHGNLETICGTYSGDIKLTRTSYTNSSAFSPTDRLSGKWTIRFESDSGEKLLFEVVDPNLRAPDL